MLFARQLICFGKVSVISLGEKEMNIAYEAADIDRLARKIGRLITMNNGQDLFQILKRLTSIKDEMRPVLDMPNGDLEVHIDKALDKSN